MWTRAVHKECHRGELDAIGRARRAIGDYNQILSLREPCGAHLALAGKASVPVALKDSHWPSDIRRYAYQDAS